MKFGQLIEYNMRNVFLRSLYTKGGGETKNFAFTVCQVKDYQNILKLGCRSLAVLFHIMLLKERKRRLELVSLPHFLHDF